MIMDVSNINKIGKTKVNNKKDNFLSFKLIFILKFFINKNVMKKKGDKIISCFPKKVKGLMKRSISNLASPALSKP